MSKLYNLPTGHILTASVNEGVGQINMIGNTDIGAVFRGSLSYGPYMVPTEFRYSGDMSVTSAPSYFVVSSLLSEGAGAPEDATQATLNFNPTGDDNSLTLTARAYGSIGNAISIAYVDPGAADAELSVSVFRQEITVSLATDGDELITSTAADVLAAIEDSVDAAKLVTVAVHTGDSGSGDDGSGIVTAMAKAPLVGGAGTGIGTADPGAIYIDTTAGIAYINTGTTAVPVWGSVAASAEVPYTVAIALAASATTDGMDITITMQDGRGDAIAGVYEFEWWISEAETGIGLTADTYSGDVTAVTGTEWIEIVSKKHYRALTAVTGIFSATAVASANPVDQYVAVRHPLTGKIIVSGASGTNWQGAV